jgi:protein-disulfide isomerase
MQLLARAKTLTPPVSARDHARGGGAAAVTLVEYGDFDCPYCVDAYPVLRALTVRFDDRLRFVFRHDPRTDLHPNALIAARASEAAALQGAFWRMHDRLFERRGALHEAALLEHALALRLDGTRFMADLRNPHVLARVRADQVGALRSGVVGAPTYFLEGHHFWGASDLETLSDAIEQRLSCRHLPAQTRFRNLDRAGHFHSGHRAPNGAGRALGEGASRDRGSGEDQVDRDDFAPSKRSES